MLGRRSHERLILSEPAEGTLRVCHDVILLESGEGELLALGRQPGIVGEVLSVDAADAMLAPGSPVRVMDSRPVIVEGSIRHRVRLEPIRGLR